MKMTFDMCQATFDSLSLDEKRWLCSIIVEYQQAMEQHPQWPADHVHAAAIVAEESGELVKAAIDHHYENGQYFNIHNEAIDTAATCLRLLVNMPELELPE